MRQVQFPSLKALREEEILLATKENYGLGPIIHIKPKYKEIGQKVSFLRKLKRIPFNLWGACLLSVLVISSPLLIYQSQINSSSGQNGRGAMTGFGVARPRWAIAGLGHIARDFCVVLSMTGANITAVAAGSLPESTSRALDFANEFNIPYSYGSYEELALNPNIDIVYIATTTQLHYHVTMLMLNAGKNVLVEKPTSMTADQTKEMFALAKHKGLLLTTNFWTRYFPAFRYARKHVDNRAIGKIISIRGDLGFQAPPDSSNKLFNPNLGGGSLYDLAAPQSLPDRILAQGFELNSGVDVETSFVLQWKNCSVQVFNGGDKALLPAKHTDLDNSTTIIDTNIDNISKLKISIPDISFVSTSRSANNKRNLRSHSDETHVQADVEVEAEANGEESDHEHLSNSNNLNIIDLQPTKDIIATFSTSLQRESTMTVEFLGEYGTVTLEGPAHTPTKVRMSISKKISSNGTEPSLSGQPLIFQEEFTTPVPHWPYKSKKQLYPMTTGFTYIIEAIEECLKRSDCRAMNEISFDEQIRIAEILESVQVEVHRNH
eukprot:gene9527-19814_t